MGNYRIEGLTHTLDNIKNNNLFLSTFDHRHIMLKSFTILPEKLLQIPTKICTVFVYVCGFHI
jgi:hypothetical protein